MAGASGMLRAWCRMDRRRRSDLAVALVQLSLASWQLRDRAGSMFGLLGQRVDAVPGQVDCLEAGPRAVAEALGIGSAVAAVARKLPWKPDCLPQALATRRICERRGIPATLWIGVRTDRGFGAHAWLEVGSTVAVGSVPVRFTPLAAYRNSPTPPERGRRADK